MGDFTKSLMCGRLDGTYLRHVIAFFITHFAGRGFATSTQVK